MIDFTLVCGELLLELMEEVGEVILEIFERSDLDFERVFETIESLLLGEREPEEALGEFEDVEEDLKMLESVEALETRVSATLASSSSSSRLSGEEILT